MSFEEWLRISKLKLEDMKLHPEHYPEKTGMRLRQYIKMLERDIIKAEKWLGRKRCRIDD